MSASIGHQLRMAVLARLLASPSTYAVTIDQDRIRASHLTVVPRENAPAIYVGPGRWIPRKGVNNSCAVKWEMRFSVGVFTRGDTTSEADADLLLVDAIKRITDDTAYTHNGRLHVDLIETDTQIADDDATRVDINCHFEFETDGYALDTQML